jgi:hypothetical protein
VSPRVDNGREIPDAGAYRRSSDADAIDRQSLEQVRRGNGAVGATPLSRSDEAACVD